jgi:hypothetical protein
MQSVEVEMDEGGSLARIEGRSYRWSIDRGVLKVRNAEGEELSPTSAKVLMSLGGAEPPWFQVVEAIFETFRTSITGGEAGVRAAVDALERSKTRRAELARTTRDRSALTALAAVGTTQVGANPLCDPHVWQLIMGNPDSDLRQRALRNNEVLPATLWDFPDEQTRLRVARNPDCPDSILAKLALQEAQVRGAVASNVHVSPELLTTLTRDDDMAVRRAVAASARCPVSCFKRLARDHFAVVRIAIVTNPEMPVRRVAARIWQDPTPTVHVALASRTDLSPRSLSWLERYSRSDPIAQYRLVCANLSANTTSSPELERRLGEIEERLAALSAADIARIEQARKPEGGVKGIRPWVILGLIFGMVAVAALVVGLVEGVIHMTEGDSVGGVGWVVGGVAIGAGSAVLAVITYGGGGTRGFQAPPRPRVLVGPLVVLGLLSISVIAKTLAGAFHGVGPVFGQTTVTVFVLAIFGWRLVRSVFRRASRRRKI